MSAPIQAGDPGPFSGIERDPTYIVCLFDVTEGKRKILEEKLGVSFELADAYYRDVLNTALLELYEGNFELVLGQDHVLDNNPDTFEIEIEKKSAFTLRRSLNFHSFREIK